MPRYGSLRQTFSAMLKRNSVAALKRRRVLRRVAEKIGLVYFGYVDQHVDDHKVVRGFSVSSTHRDDNYATGSYEDYQMAIVDRYDVVTSPNQRVVDEHTWFIVEIELQAHTDMPHAFLLPKHQANIHYKKVFNAFLSLEPLRLADHSPEFSDRYTIYGSALHHDAIEDMFRSDITRTMAAHFWPTAVEIKGSSVFLYYVEPSLSEHAVESVIKNGIWLCQMLDNVQ